jgi:hypothetical protein
MIKFQEKYHYTISRRGGLEEWLTTTKALLNLIANQNPESPADNYDIQQACNLIFDMLPDEDQVCEIEKALKRCA